MPRSSMPFPNQNNEFLFSLIHATCPAHLILFLAYLLKNLVKNTNHEASHYVIFSNPLLLPSS